MAHTAPKTFNLTKMCPMMIKCVGCDFVSNEELISEHLAAAHGISRTKNCTLPKKDPLECPMCNFKTPIGFLLNAHFYVDHKINTLSTCPYCGVSNTGKNLKETHIKKIHNVNLMFKCLCCDYSCLKEETLRKHVDIEHWSRLSYRCSMCDGEFSGVLDVIFHVSVMHNKSPLSGHVLTEYNLPVKEKVDAALSNGPKKILSNAIITCPRCGSGFDDEKALLIHLKECHSVHYYVCPVCLLVYLDEKNLLNHCIDIHNVSSDKAAKIPLKASVSLSTKQIKPVTSKSKENSKSNSLQKDLASQEIKPQEPSKPHLDSSKHNHSDKKACQNEHDLHLEHQKSNSLVVIEAPFTFVCSQCPDIFYSKELIEKHVQMSHPLPVIKSSASSRTISPHANSNLGDREGRHAPNKEMAVKVHHEANLVYDFEAIKLSNSPPQQMSYHCIFCEFCHPLKTQMEKHILLNHETKLPFNCYLCDQKFITQKQLDDHFSESHQVLEAISVKAIFPCLLCSYTSQIKEHVKHHLKDVHGFLL